jgi:hypothetical protein
MSKIYEQYQKITGLGFGLQDFFNISFNEFDISFLGYSSKEKIDKYQKFGFEFSLKGTQLIAYKNGIWIFLQLN